MKLSLTSFCAICALLYGETFAMYNSNIEQDSLSRSSSSSDFFNSDVEEITYSTDTTKEPELVQVPCPEGRRICEVLHMAFCIYSKELDTRNPQNLEWLKKGGLFPNLEQLKISADDLKIVARKRPFKKLRVLEVNDSVRNIEELTKALSQAPNLEKLILIDTGMGINRKLGYVIGKLANPNLIKKVTLQEKNLMEIPDSLLVLPNIEQITIDDIVHDRTVIEKERNSRNINTVDKEKLIQAVKEGRLDDLKQRIKSIDLLDLREDLSKVAVSAGQADVIKFLINDKVDVNARYKNGNTLLMEATQNNRLDIANILINKGANVRAKNEKGKTALSLVIDEVKCIRNDIEFERNKTKRDKLIKKRTELIKMVKLLGNNGADLNEKNDVGDSLLSSAIWRNDIDLVKALLNAGDAKNILPLVLSYKNKIPLSNEQIKDLRKSTIDLNENTKNTNGNTLLMLAIKEGYNEIVKLLIDHGADIEAKNKNGDTTLGYVASLWGNKTKTIKMLLDRGANIDARNNEGSTPLMNAAKEGNTKIIQVLLDRGANIDTRNNEGSTPLIKAVGNNQYKAAIFLIDKGADPFVKNNKGKTALSLAENVIHEHNTKGRWADFVADGAKRVIEKIKVLDQKK